MKTVKMSLLKESDVRLTDLWSIINRADGERDQGNYIKKQQDKQRNIRKANKRHG